MDTSKKIAILTDSNSDLPAEYFKKYPIFQLPLGILCGETEYRDGINITVQDVYRRQPKENFKTSLPRSEDITATLDAIKCAGYSQVIVLLLAGALSGTTNVLRLMAAERTDLDIAVFDTHEASVGVGILALQAAQYAVRGVPFHLLKRLVAQLILDTKVYFSLNTLEYLQRGGRIGKAAAVAGTLLQIKPILTFDETGTIDTAAKVRGRRAVQDRLVQLVTARAAQDPGLKYSLLLCDGDVPEEAAALKAALTAALPKYEQVLHGKLDATLAIHLGPQLLGAGIQFLRSDIPG